MPFDEPYRTDFQPGDLVYGLAIPRAEWVLRHSAGQGKNWIDKFNTDMTQIDASDAVNADFIIETLKHPKYHSVMNTANHASSSASKQHGWRTKSKAGLNWAVTKGKHVHFILDLLDIEAVAGKTNSIGNPDFPQGKASSAVAQKDKIRTITNAELRWIYRHKDNPDVQKYIQFWLDNKTSPPPWYSTFTVGLGKKAKTGPQLWSAYTPTHTYDKDLIKPD